MGSLRTISFDLKPDNFRAIGFGMAQEYEDLGCPHDFEVLGTLAHNYFCGKDSIQFEILAMRQ